MRAAEERCYPLQPIAATRTILEPGLYFRADAALQPVEDEGRGLHLPAGCTVDFDTFVNAFFEWHWVRHTATSATALVLDTQGLGSVVVYRTEEGGGRRKLAEAEIGEAGSTTVCLSAYLGEPARLSFTLFAHKGGLTLKTGFWATSAPPLRHVDLKVVICTFNNCKLVTSTLERLLGCAEDCKALGQVVVVDQGTQRVRDLPDLPASVQRSLQSGLLALFEQDNLGGSGGFTRGIIEALRDEAGCRDCTHILLMDDDVQFEGRLLNKLASFYAYAAADVVVGGAMMDMFRPEHLFAYTEHFNVKTAHVERWSPFDLDMRREENLGKLQAARTGNYNGWFACCFPRSAFETYGLPLPFFIRSDDCEFGMRLTRAGMPLVHMPGFFVWHEPFWNKPRAWIDYYTFRNHVIAADLGSARPVRGRPFKRWSEFWYYITVYQYDTALALCMATEHYCQGPATIFGNPRGRHAAVLAEITDLTRPLSPIDRQDVGRGNQCPRVGEPPASRTKPWLPLVITFFCNVYWNLFGHALCAEREGPALQAVLDGQLGWKLFHRFPVVLVDLPGTGASTVLRHDAATARTLTLRMVRSSIFHAVRLQRLHTAYKTAAAHYTTVEFWKDLIGLVR